MTTSSGGDHLVSLPILRALAKDKPVGMFQFDSHSDTWDTYFGGFKYTHGTPFRRAIEENLIDPKKYVILGLRGGLYDPDDLKWAIDQGITIISTDKFYEKAISANDIIDYIYKYFPDSEEKYRILIITQKVKKEFRNEKLLIFFILNLIVTCSTINYQDILSL